MSDEFAMIARKREEGKVHLLSNLGSIRNEMIDYYLAKKLVQKLKR